MSDAPSPTHQPIKVLHVSAGNVIGGVESVLLALADGKSVPSLQQEFALTFDGPFAESLGAKGASVDLLPNSKLRNPVVRDPLTSQTQHIDQRATV